MSHASIPPQYWDHIFQSVVFLINRLPPTSSPHLSPYTLLFKKQPDYTFLRVLGCLCYPLLRPYNAHKLQFHSLPCVFLGYCQLQKGYKCLHLPTEKIYISRNVRFDETKFPFSSLPSEFPRSLDGFSSSLPILTSPALQTNARHSTVQPIFEPITQPRPVAVPSPQQPDPLLAAPNFLASTRPAMHSGPIAPPIDLPSQDPADLVDLWSTSNSAAPLTSACDSPVTCTPPVQPKSASTHHMITRQRDNTRKKRIFQDHVTLLATKHPLPPPIDEPTSFTSANKLPEWRDAMAKELTTLAQNGTWVLVPPCDHHVIGCKWIYKVKRKADGTIERHKARLVAKGYNQEEGIDYHDTFSPVVKPTTIRVVLSLAVSQKWCIRQLDVNNAFLHGDLHETVYMAQPPGFVDPLHPTHVCLLKKALYGLKQASHAWFHKLASALADLGFKPSQSDPSLFICATKFSLTIVLVYVDDIIVTGSHEDRVLSLISSLSSRFSLKDLGFLHYFLGIQVTNTSLGIHLSQPKYIRDLLLRSKMDGAKPCASPCTPGLSLSQHHGSPMADPHMYRSVVGALQYATITRPDISFAVNKASQFMHSPTDDHWNAVKRILRYLKGTITHGLHLHATSSFDLHAYSDADWAGCPDDRRSTTGFCVFLGSNLLSWGSKKQTTVSRSSTEAEYRSMAVACKELIWLQQLLQELHVPSPSKPTLWC